MSYTVAMRITLRPVGKVENNILHNRKFDAEETILRITMDKRYSRALDGIETFSHIIILFWLNQIKERERLVLKVHPRRDTDLPLTGVFATRSPVRPNPLGITTVKLIKREGNVLTVKGLDAVNGTPVLDIKPYIPEDFSSSEVAIAGWVKKREIQST